MATLTAVPQPNDDLVPLADGALLAAISYHRLMRLVCIRAVRGERRAGKWFCSRSDVLRWAAERDGVEVTA